MDDRRFDALARGLAAGRDRRSLLTTLLGLGAVAVTGASYGDIGLCAQASGFCAIETTGGATACVSLAQAPCTECTHDQDCAAISGAVCIQSWPEVCSTATMCAQAI